jgi:phosphoribosyl 1,2-cyclic phosphate phosphodiesterase
VRITFIGTGDAGGVPLYGCDCAACSRAHGNSDYRRRNCGALVESGDTRVLIDAGLTDLTERFAPGSLSAILVTHFHPDHVQGLFHLRWGKGASILVYAPPDSEGCADLYKNHGLLDFRKLAKFHAFSVGDLTITPVPLIHSKVTFGYAIEDRGGQLFAYLTDTVGLPPLTEIYLSSWRPDGMALDCSHPPREPASRNHNDFTRALESIDAIAPKNAWLIHIGHEFDCWEMSMSPGLPQGIRIARDGEMVELLHHNQDAPAC